MGDRVNGFYYARWEALYPESLCGHGVIFLKEGTVFGGDSQACFAGEYEGHGDEMIARVKIFSPDQAYSAVGGQLEEKHRTVNLFLQQISLICDEDLI